MFPMLSLLLWAETSFTCRLLHLLSFPHTSSPQLTTSNHSKLQWTLPKDTYNLTPKFWQLNPNDFILGAWQPVCIYSRLQHVAVTWPPFMTFFPENQKLIFSKNAPEWTIGLLNNSCVLFNNCRFTMVICLMTAAKKGCKLRLVTCLSPLTI